MDINNYKVEIRKISEDDGGGFIATVPRLPGCMSDGETAVEALTNVQDAIQCWIETAEELGREIPSPMQYKSEDDYSGKLTLRLPKYLHKQVAEQAKEEECSINQLIQSYIAIGIGKELGKNHISIKVSKEENLNRYLIDSVDSQWKRYCDEGSISKDFNDILEYDREIRTNLNNIIRQGL